jgi:hypothetical protein
MYCVRFKGNACTVGYLRPWNSVRDGETYSMTYLPTSIIDGIKDELKCSGNILRHKLRFNGMTSELFKSPMIEEDRLNKRSKKIEKTIKRENGISTIHQICSPEIILGFEKIEDAIEASKNSIYVGQTQYMIYPVKFEDADEEDTDEKDVDNEEGLIVEMSDEEFSSLKGTETFPTNKEDENGVYCGNNRFRDNERMYIRIVRTK